MSYAHYDCPSCGNQVRVGGAGYTHDQAEAAARNGGPCHRCRADAFHQANLAAVASAEGAGLPALTGTDKQVSWASALRIAALPLLDQAGAELRKLIAGVAANGAYPPEAVAEAQALAARIADEFRGQTDSKWWIEGDWWHSDKDKTIGPDSLFNAAALMNNELRLRLEAEAPAWWRHQVATGSQDGT